MVDAALSAWTVDGRLEAAAVCPGEFTALVLHLLLVCLPLGTSGQRTFCVTMMNTIDIRMVVIYGVARLRQWGERVLAGEAGPSHG